MKTIDSFIEEAHKKFKESYKSPATTTDIKKAVKELIKDYAKEAIKEDRKNVAEHAEVDWRWNENQGDYAVVDKDSIINAPQIELK